MSRMEQFFKIYGFLGLGTKIWSDPADFVDSILLCVVELLEFSFTGRKVLRSKAEICLFRWVAFKRPIIPSGWCHFRSLSVVTT